MRQLFTRFTSWLSRNWTSFALFAVTLTAFHYINNDWLALVAVFAAVVGYGLAWIAGRFITAMYRGIAEGYAEHRDVLDEEQRAQWDAYMNAHYPTRARRFLLYTGELLSLRREVR